MSKLRRRRFSLPLLCLFSVFSLLLPLLCISVSGSDRHFAGETADYYQSLLDAGFPASYAEPLTELHLLHPEWEFEALRVTSLNSQYTWDYILSAELAREDTNLVAPSAPSVYRANANTYDAGYYPVSRATLAYFMDPRNFLNEADLFQFYSCAYPDDESGLADAVGSVLRGTFMENAILENGMTYRDWFLSVGKELGIHPIFLAVKVRQEQGVSGSSPLISGSCGSTLWSYYINQTATTDDGKEVLPPASGQTKSVLSALNGYYNYFNVGASGNGVFTIYKNGMNRAITGSPAKSADWGGSPSWNTRWKSIWGGADILRSHYVSSFQPTVYLQRFNVDPRYGSDGQNHQYMQNISGALSEGRTLWRAFVSAGISDDPAAFLIPVFDGMPTENPDPAKGTYSSFAPADTKFSTEITVTSPIALHSKNQAAFADITLQSGKELHLSGSVTHSYGVVSLAFRWEDEDEWTPLPLSGSFFDLKLSTLSRGFGDHTVIIRGTAAYTETDAQKKNSQYFSVSVVHLTLTPPPSVNVTLKVGNTETVKSVFAGREQTLPRCDSADFVGWVGSDGSFLPSGGKFTTENDLTYTAVFADFSTLPGASLGYAGNGTLRFSALLDGDSFDILTSLPSGSAVFQADRILGDSRTPCSVSFSALTYAGKSYLRLDAETDSLAGTDPNAGHNMAFSILLSYSDGTSKRFLPSGATSTRSLSEVASAALADRSAGYSEEILNAIRSLLSHE